MKSEIVPTHIAPPVHEFVQLYSSTPRGARLARLMGTQQLAAWGWPYDGQVSRDGALLIGELTANAVTHGRVPGRSFRLRLLTGPGLLLPGTLRVEVADALGEARPDAPQVLFPDAESGRGLLLVDALAARWGVEPRPPSGKTVWAELDLSNGGSSASTPGASCVRAAAAQRYGLTDR